MSERYADGFAVGQEVWAAEEAASEAAASNTWATDIEQEASAAASVTGALWAPAIWGAGEASRRALGASGPQRNRELNAQCRLLHCIFGNPFRPVTLDPRWLSSTVVDLARTIYDDRKWDRMPVLADALMDAGCDSEEIIKHCQGPGPHVLGCWVVDLILGKN